MQPEREPVIPGIIRRLGLFAAVLAAINVITFVSVFYVRHLWPTVFNIVTEPLPLLTPLQEYVHYLTGSPVAAAPDSIPGMSPEAIQREILAAIPKSLVLLGLSLVFSSVAGIGLGLASVDTRTHQISSLALLASLAGFSMPGFYMAIVLTYTLIQLSFRSGQPMPLPVTGYGIDAHLILPVLALSVRPAAEVARLTAEMLGEELPKEYVRAARAKGLPWRLVVLRHAFRNVLVTVIVALGNNLRSLVSSLILIEYFFQWPGLGRALVATLIPAGTYTSAGFDPSYAAGLVTVVGAIFLLSSAATDLLTAAVDPRVRQHRASA